MSMIDDPMIAALGRFLDVNVARLRLIDANLANVDTPGFQARDLDFRAELGRAARQAVEGDEAGRLSYASSFSSSTSSLPYTPVARPVRGLLQRPDGNNVSVERESLLLAETQMKYSLGVQLLKDEFHGISQAINSGGTSS
jgi:flagellar basal-body rod protein FlgB